MCAVQINIRLRLQLLEASWPLRRGDAALDIFFGDAKISCLQHARGGHCIQRILQLKTPRQPWSERKRCAAGDFLDDRSRAAALPNLLFDAERFLRLNKRAMVLPRTRRDDLP